MDLSIDSLCLFVLIPLLRYPVVVSLFLSYWSGSAYPTLQGALLVYVVCVNILIEYNNRAKVRGPWRWLSEINNPVCVLTGGSGGLGRDILKNLLERFPSAVVVIVDIAEPDIVDKRVKFYKVDLSDENEVDLVSEKILSLYGHVNVLINCAGMRTRYQGFLDTDSKEVHKVFQVNVFSPIQFIRKLAPKSSKTNDTNNHDVEEEEKDEAKNQFYTVTVGSALGIVAPARISGYASTKSALIAFHNSWTHELLNNGITNIRTLLVLPGQLNTGMFGGFRPPRQFFAPVVDSERLAKEIVHCCDIGKRGEICAPFYVYFMHLLAAMPFAVSNTIRWFSQMDSCLPDDGN